MSETIKQSHEESPYLMLEQVTREVSDRIQNLLSRASQLRGRELTHFTVFPHGEGYEKGYFGSTGEPIDSATAYTITQSKDGGVGLVISIESVRRRTDETLHSYKGIEIANDGFATFFERKDQNGKRTRKETPATSAHSITGFATGPLNFFEEKLDRK